MRKSKHQRRVFNYWRHYSALLPMSVVLVFVCVALLVLSVCFSIFMVYPECYVDCWPLIFFPIMSMKEFMFQCLGMVALIYHTCLVILSCHVFWYFSYGLVWISTTLMFLIASLGNCSTYLMDKRSDSSTSWSFDVNYINVAACAIYGYTVIVPLAFYFLLQYLGSNPRLVCFWCMWGYSLFIFVLSSVCINCRFRLLIQTTDRLMNTQWPLALPQHLSCYCYCSYVIRNLSFLLSVL